MEPVILSLPHIAQDVTTLYAEQPLASQYESELLRLTIELRNLKSRIVFGLKK